VKIDIPALLVHLRAKSVEEDKARNRPTAWGAAMKAASFVMADAGRFATAEKGLALGRIVAGRSGRISSLPFPGSLWTEARDLPAPPKETFRSWWERTHPETGPTPGGERS
jgi:L-lactate dehydrogenase complex protein LldF